MIPFSTWVVWILRKASYRWPSRYQALKAAKTGPNTFRCAKCKTEHKKEGKKRTITVDHIIPVKDPARPQAFQEALTSCSCGVCDYIRKMFCGPEGLQVLCKNCHDEKTGKEMKERKVARRFKKKEEKHVSKSR